MFASIRLWVSLAAVVAVAGTLTYSHVAAYQSGKQSVLDTLKDDRITILKDGQEIDNEVIGADDDYLCKLLGGCVPDEGADDAL